MGFKKVQGFISSQCDQSLSTGPARSKRSYGGGHYPGGYDPSTIWFQYLLCHEQKISCYFFTQGWNEKEFGQYYLYENVLDTDLHGLGHASSGADDHLLTLLLLAGAGGSHQPYHAYPSYRKRRDVEDKVNKDEPKPNERRRRSNDEEQKLNERRRRSNDEEQKPSERRRRSNDEEQKPSERRRRSKDEEQKPSERRRRSNTDTKVDEVPCVSKDNSC